MKAVLVLLTIATIANADDPKFFIKGKEGTKADAIRALVLDPKAEVVKCNEQELTNKATLRNK